PLRWDAHHARLLHHHLARPRDGSGVPRRVLAARPRSQELQGALAGESGDDAAARGALHAPAQARVAAVGDLAAGGGVGVRDLRLHGIPGARAGQDVRAGAAAAALAICALRARAQAPQTFQPEGRIDLFFASGTTVQAAAGGAWTVDQNVR